MKGGQQYWPKIGLHPAILRTCKRAYAEALSILYEQNIFTYVTSNIRFEAAIATEDPLKDKTRSIKHVRNLRCLV